MAKSNCQIVKDGHNDLDVIEQAIQDAIITEADVIGMKELVQQVDEHFKTASEEAIKELLYDVIPENEIEDFINQQYGTQGERYLLAFKIATLFIANPLMKDMVQEELWRHMPSGKKGKSALPWAPSSESIESSLFGKGGLEKKDFDKLSKEEQLKQILRVQPVGTLKVIYRKAWNWATAKEDFVDENTFAKGAFGKFMVRWTTPKELGKKERSGAYFKFSQQMDKYYESVENDIGNFMYKRTVTKRIKGKSVKVEFKGMSDIFKDLEDMVLNIKKWKLPKGEMLTKKQKMIEFFIRYMIGEIEFDGTQFKANKNWGTTGEFYEGTKKPIFAFSDPVDLKDFRNGSFNIPFTKTQIKSFLSMTKEARKIEDALYKHSRKEFLESVDAMKSALRKHFPDLSEGEVFTLFFEEWKIKDRKKILDRIKYLDDKHKTSYMEKYNTFKETFGNIAKVEMFRNQANESEYRRNHFPIRYPNQTFKLMWDSYIDGLEKEEAGWKKRRNQIIKVIENNLPYSSAKFESPRNELEYVNEKLSITQSQLKRARNISEMKDGIYPEDMVRGEEMPFVRHHKHLKRVTNAFDIRNLNVDKAVYYEHLNETFAAINRNKLTAEMLEALLLTKSESVQKGIINYYKVPFNSPTVEGPLGISDQKIANALGMDVHNIQRISNRINKVLSATFLGGMSTAIINKVAIMQTVQDWNFNAVQDAQEYMNQHPEEVAMFIAKSGVAAFQDFFSKSLVNDKVGFNMDNHSVEKIYAAMLNHPATKEMFSNMSKSALIAQMKKVKLATEGVSKEDMVNTLSLLEFRALVKDIMKNSPAYNLEVNKILAKDDIKIRKQNIISKKLDAILNTWVEYALTKEYEINHFASMFNWKYKTPANIYKGLSVWWKAKGEIYKSANLTMSAGESWIRSISFIVGVLQAQRLGYIDSSVHMWELEGEELSKAMEIGRKISKYSNMGLSSTDMGAAGYGSLGKWLQKFNYWGFQKNGRDWRVTKNAAITQMGLVDLHKTGFFPWAKAVTKIIKKGAVPGKYSYWSLHNYNKMNIAQKEVAQMYKFLTTGVLTAALMDLVIWGPLGNLAMLSVIKNTARAVGLGGMIRGLPSMYAQGLASILVFAIQAAAGFDDDDDEWEETSRFMRKFVMNAPFGYGVTWTMDWLLLIFHIALERGELAANSFMDIARPVFPSATTHGLSKDALQSLIDED